LNGSLVVRHEILGVGPKHRFIRGHRQVAVPAEKGVRDGHTDALSGTAVLGGEGHFSLLDTVGDREGRSSIGGLLDRRDERGQGRREKSREQSGRCT